MAVIPQPQDLAREILAVLHEAGRRPGEGMNIAALRSKFGDPRPGEDLQAGLTHALEQGWVKVSDSGWVSFTAAGFAEA